MKKFLFRSFLSLLGLLALGTFFLGSDANAQLVGPKIDRNGNLFNWSGNPSYGTIYYGENVPSIGWQCGNGLNNPNWLPPIGRDLVGGNGGQGGGGYTDCVGLSAGDTIPLVGYIAHPIDNVWYKVTISTAGFVQSVQPLSIIYNHKASTPGGYATGTPTSVVAPLYQTGRPYYNLCPGETPLNVPPMHAVHYCVDGGTSVGHWEGFNTPQWCSPYKKGINNYHDITYGIDTHTNNIYVYNNPAHACVPEEEILLELPASCGTANGTYATTKPTTKLCGIGNTSSPVAGSGPWTWSCTSNDNGEVIQCATLATAENGTCGSANGGTFTSIPTSNLCNAGSSSSVAGSGPWTWSCNGLNGGSSASCSATKSAVPVNAVCGTSHNQATSAFPTGGLCNVGTPVIGATTPNGSNNFTWTCLGANGGSTVACLAPYEPVACVPYSPSIIAASATRVTPSSDDIALSFKNTEYANNTILDKVRYVSSSGYSFTGLLTPTQYLKVTITDLTNAGQFVQYRPTPISVTDYGGKGGSNKVIPVAGATPFFGCEAPQWGALDPILWNYNLPFQNNGMMVDSADLARGYILPISDPLHYMSAFVAWNKAGKGFKVNCEVCPLTIPVTTRQEACKNLPEHAIPNTVSVITQTASGSVWTPSDIFSYNLVASTSECRFVCEDNYTWNGSACIANAQTAVCTGSIPANAVQNGTNPYGQTRDGSSRQPSGLAWNYNASPNICTFECRSNYTWNGSACKANTKTALCAGSIPANATQNGTNPYTQTRNNISRQPSGLAWNYNASPNICTFACNIGYSWNGSACIQNITYAWETSVWGACTETPGQCTGTYGYLDDSTNNCSGPCGQWQTLSCEGPQDETTCKNPQGLPNGSQGSYNFNVGDMQAFCTWTPPSSTGIQTRTVVCKDNNGNTVADSLCPAPKPDTSQAASCSTNTYVWNVGTRSVCSNNTQTRPVVCKDYNGNTVIDALCPAPKPNTSQAASCPPVGACGGFGHVYVKEINRVRTKDLNYPGENECNASVPQRENEDTCTYAFYSNAAGTLPINVTNLSLNINSVGTYNSSYVSIKSGMTFTQVCRTEEQLDFPPAGCSNYMYQDTSLANNTCVTVIDGGGSSQPVCGATEGSCLVGTVEGRNSSLPANQLWYCEEGGNSVECAMPAQCGTRYGSYMFPTGTSAMPTDSSILCKYGSANPVPTLYGGNQITSFTAWTCNGLNANSSVACTGSIGCQYILNGSPQTCG